MPAQYPNNLNEVFSGGDPIAMRFARDQQANAMNQDALDQQRQTLANQYSEQTNPIKAQQEQATLEQTLAQNPGIAATSRKLGVEANIAEATQGSDIKAKLSKNLSAMSDDQIKRLGNMGQSMIHMADLVDAGQQMPLEMQQSIPPEIVQALATPEGRAKLRQRGQQMALDTSEHLRAKQLKGMDNATSIRVAEIGAESRLQQMRMRMEMQAKTALEKANKATEAKDFKSASIHWDNLADQMEASGDPKAADARARATYYARLATTAPVNQAGVDTSAAANSGAIRPPQSPATGAPSMGGSPRPDPLGIRQ